MASYKTILRDARLPHEPPQPVRVQDAVATVADASSYVSWKDAQVASGTGPVYAIVEAWRDREDWRPTSPAPIQWPFPFHSEHGDAYALRLVEWLAPAATSTASEIAAAEAAVELYVTTAIGSSNIDQYAWFWTGACANPQSPVPVDASLGQWIPAVFAFKGYGLEDDPGYCPI